MLSRSWIENIHIYLNENSQNFQKEPEMRKMILCGPSTHPLDLLLELHFIEVTKSSISIWEPSCSTTNTHVIQSREQLRQTRGICPTRRHEVLWTPECQAEYTSPKSCYSGVYLDKLHCISEGFKKRHLLLLANTPLNQIYLLKEELLNPNVSETVNPDLDTLKKSSVHSQDYEVLNVKVW